MCSFLMVRGKPASTQYVDGSGTWRKEKAFLDEATSQFADRTWEGSYFRILKF